VTAAAGTGLGFAAARRAAEEGASVMVSDLHERRLAEAVDKLEELSGRRPASVLCNVTVQEEVDRMIAAAVNELGHVDVLINNAGLGLTADVVDTSDEQWQAVLDITLTGTFRVTRAVLPHMYERGCGAIVNNTSVIAWRAQVGQAAYAAAKAGVGALTRCTALEAAPHGVRVNAVSPSLAMHPFLSKVMPQKILDELVDLEAFKRSAETWEVANVMVFLASDYASYMTGEVVPVSSQRA
jgi:3-oxoacyl-[acyl-carrier protein] reductase